MNYQGRATSPAPKKQRFQRTQASLLAHQRYIDHDMMYHRTMDTVVSIRTCREVNIQYAFLGCSVQRFLGGSPLANSIIDLPCFTRPPRRSIDCLRTSCPVLGLFLRHPGHHGHLVWPQRLGQEPSVPVRSDSEPSRGPL